VRHLGASLLIGALVSMLLLVFDHIGIFAWLALHVQNFLAGHPLTAVAAESQLFKPLQVAAVIVGAFGVAWTTVEISVTWRKWLVGILAIVVILLLPITLGMRGVLFEPFSGAMAALLALIAGTVQSMTFGGKKDRYLRSLLGRKLSANRLDAVMARSSKLKLDGEHRDMSVLVCRIFNHGEIRSTLEPADAVLATNLFHKAAAEYLTRKGGYIEEPLPGSVTAFFGAPEADDAHALHACEAALGLRRRLLEVHQECENRWRVGVDFGISVVSGAITMALFGSKRDPRYTGYGWEIEFARRLCGANLTFGSQILVGETTKGHVDEMMAMRPMSRLHDPETRSKQGVYELIESDEKVSEVVRTGMAAFGEGMALFEAQNYAGAIPFFAKARITGRDDVTLEYFVEKANYLQMGRGGDVVVAAEDEEMPMLDLLEDTL
jgi:class 3 adenylate cyclase